MVEGVGPRGVNSQSTWEAKDVEPVSWGCTGESGSCIWVCSQAPGGGLGPVLSAELQLGGRAGCGVQRARTS